MPSHRLPAPHPRRAFTRWLLACLLALPLTALGAEPPAEGLAGGQLLSALRQGGLIVYFRHTSTDFGQNDDRMTGYEDCTRQRNLTDAGREEARRIGAAIKRLAFPVGEVLASPFCRTRETAQLIFGRATSSDAVRGGPAQPDSPDRYTELRRLLATAPPAGTNLAIVSHGNPFRAVAGGNYLAEGEAAVIRPLGEEGFRIVARVTKDGWQVLAP